MRRHPLITFIFFGCTLLGAVLGPAVFSHEWSIWRRLAAGLVTGIGVGFMITATRLQGGWED